MHITSNIIKHNFVLFFIYKPILVPSVADETFSVVVVVVVDVVVVVVVDAGSGVVCSGSCTSKRF